jgi:molybdopterin molybdotransferase
VVRPLLLRLAGALPEPLTAVPARATFRYKKKKDRREYIRVTARGTGAGLELEKYPHEGAGLLASLTETTGLAEIAEDVTSIEPGDTIGYLPYAMLLG